MPDALCQVCCNPKRKPRFLTLSLCICQWCISELTNSLEAPDEIVKAARDHMREKRMAPLRIELAALERIKLAAPEPPTAELERAQVLARRQVVEREGIGQYFYRQLIDDSARVIEATALAKDLERTIALEHEANIKRHERRMIGLRASISAVRTKLADVEEFVAADFQRFMEIRLSQRITKHSTTRILRAHALGLIQPDRVYAKRPEGTEAEEMARHVRKRDRYVCVICGRLPKGSELHVHHIIPLSFFGTNNEQNLATLCYACHNRQHPEFSVQRMQRRVKGTQ